ncbi:MAG: hypothetical protein HY062_15700 [Bacteroidetes bacterium]|nr:hypothetical protein [Bacteroidota bacterium]
MNTTTCYYCNTQAAEARYAFKKIIYNKLDSNYGLGLTGIKKTTRYYEKEFLIPRCANCAIEHGKPNKPAGIIALVVFAISGSFTYTFAKRWYVAVIAGIICGIVAMSSYFILVYHKRLKTLGIKDANNIKDFSPVKDLLDNGWQTIKP